MVYNLLSRKGHLTRSCAPCDPIAASPPNQDGAYYQLPSSLLHSNVLPPSCQPQPFHQLRHVLRQGRCPGFGLASGRVAKAESGGTQGHAFEAAGLGIGLAMDRPIVDAFATDRRAGFAEMNANLVGTPCLQTAFGQGEVAELRHDANVRNRAFALTGIRCAAPPSVAAIFDKVGFNLTFLGVASYHGQVAALNRMRPELLAQVALRFGSPRENDQAAGFLIEPMHGAHSSRFSGLPSGN